jgi:hypothetical protein
MSKKENNIENTPIPDKIKFKHKKLEQKKNMKNSRDKNIKHKVLGEDEFLNDHFNDHFNEITLKSKKNSHDENIQELESTKEHLKSIQKIAIEENIEEEEFEDFSPDYFEQVSIK